MRRAVTSAGSTEVDVQRTAAKSRRRTTMTLYYLAHLLQNAAPTVVARLVEGKMRRVDLRSSKLLQQLACSEH